MGIPDEIIEFYESLSDELKDCYMMVGGWAFDPSLIGGEYFIKVIYIEEEQYYSLHRFSDFSLVETTMPEDMIEAYTPFLNKNRELLEDGLDWHKRQEEAE